MIIVMITMHAHPDKQIELMQTLRSITKEMTKVAAGFQSHALVSDIGNHNLLILFEEWRSRQELDAHLRSEIFSVLLGTKSLLNQPHGIQIFTIHHAEGMEAVKAARANAPRAE